MHLFPDEYADDALARTAHVWDLTAALPTPKHPLTCPLCNVGTLAIKDWKFHVRAGVGSKHPWRCDTRLKCMTCGGVHTFGVIVPRAMFEAHRARSGHRVDQWIHWREGRRIIEEES